MEPELDFAFFFAQGLPQDIDISHSEPSAGGFDGETDRDQGSGVFGVNSGAFETCQVLQEPSPN